MSLEDLEAGSEIYKLAKWIGEEMLLMKRSGRLEDGYLKYLPNDPTDLAYHFMEKLEQYGYVIKKK